VGALLWLGAAGAVMAWARGEADRFRGPFAKLARYATAPRTTYDLNLPGPLKVGDPLLGINGEWAGAVVAIHSGAYQKTWDERLPPATSYSVRVALDPEIYPRGLPEGLRLTSGTTPGDPQWIMETLLPPHKRDMVAREIRAFMDTHKAKLTAFVRPLAEEVVGHGMEVMEANLNSALSKREKQIRALLDTHREKLREEIVPVLKEELGPSAKEKADPILREIGRELWDALPVWSLSWRAFVDVLPGTRKDRVDKWWKEFVDKKAIPILGEHEPELMKMLEDLIEEGGRNKKVRAVLGKATHRLAKDPRFRVLVRGILEDALIRPFQWREVFDKIARQPKHRQRLDRLVRAFQPVLQRLAHELTINTDTGKLDPDLVKVLRRVVFYKDSRWVRVVLSEPGSP
jgi:hypothetical protein